MSLKTWKEEFYPIPASEVEIGAAVDHSITKWRGLKPENLKKHNVVSNEEGIFDESPMTSAVGVIEQLPINSESCALCSFYIDARCGHCPLYLVRRGVRCDVAMADETLDPFGNYIETGNPEPMIEWLVKAAAAYKDMPKVVTKYFGSFTVTVVADNEEQRRAMLDRLGDYLDACTKNCGIDIQGFYDTANQWEEDETIRE